MPGSTGSTLLALLVSLSSAGAWGEALDPATLAREMAASRLEVARAVAVRDVRIGAGPAMISLDEGLLVPATPVGGKTAEMVFLGRGRIEMEPPNAMEAGQMERLAGARRLDEDVTEAVFVVGGEDTYQRLLLRPRASLGVEQARRCEAVWSAWRRSAERRRLDVDTAVLSLALGLPSSRGAFAARFRGLELGDFVYSVDPTAREQVTVGRLSPSADGLQTWISSSLLTESGLPLLGQADFEPRKYVLTLNLAADDAASGVARIDLAPAVQGARLVKLRLAAGLAVSRVTDGAGRELFFLPSREGASVFFPETVGRTAAVEIEYSGKARSDPLLWFPHTGTTDRAAYDVTFRWPRELDLMAGGRRAGGGEEDGMRWERRTIEWPAGGFAFAIGHYRVETALAGNLKVRLAFDAAADRMERRARDEITDTVVHALIHFDDLFGRYPLDEITVVTGSREISRSPAPGLVTLAPQSADDLAIASLVFKRKDRRLIVARAVAGQWWGQSVGWAGDRELWLGEALASYAAAHYFNEQLRGDGPYLEITEGWKTDLLASLPGRSTVGTIGTGAPIALGNRLSDCLSPGAGRALLYKKGAVILGMLAQDLQEHPFEQALRQIYGSSSGQVLSTPGFLRLLQGFTKADLQSFAEEFIAGTVLPEILYSLRLERIESKEIETWRLTGRAVQQIPYRYRFKIVEREREGLDVVREAEEEIPVRSSTFVIPFGLAADRPRRSEIFRLNGELTDFVCFYYGFEAAEPWIDRGAQVFALFFEEGRNPQRALFDQGLKAAAGQRDAAEDLFEQALKLRGESLEGPIEIARARLLMDRGRDEEAGEALGRARGASQDAAALDLTQARLDVRIGRYEEAFQLLTSRGDALDRAEAGALLAIAAQATGRTEDFARALRRARGMAVDVEILGAYLHR